jgi:hypothetical protein
VDNPFENPKPSQEDKAIEKNIKALVEISAKLLKNPDYEKYKKMYYDYREEVYAILQDDTEIDSQKYTIKSKTLLSELRVLGLLINKVESDAQIVKRRAKK